MIISKFEERNDVRKMVSFLYLANVLVVTKCKKLRPINIMLLKPIMSINTNFEVTVFIYLLLSIDESFVLSI